MNGWIGRNSPCPGCGEVGPTLEAWNGPMEPEYRLKACPTEDCRVDNYNIIPQDNE